VKERPILFSAPMVRAILEGRKTQTRRVIPFPSTGAFVLQETSDGGWWPCVSMDGESADDGTGNEVPMNCRYGGAGDRLWVKETFAAWYRTSVEYPLEYEKIAGNLADWAALHGAGGIQIAYRADRDDDEGWRPSIFMPRWASRITLEVADVRVQQLQEITEEDAIAEGVEPYSMTARDIADCQISDCSPQEKELARLMGPGSFSHKFTYQMLWDELNAKRGFGWEKNPWVWAITFKRVTA
jgi:hypothetical protein